MRALRRDGASSKETDGDGARAPGEGSRPASEGTRAVSAGFGARKRASSVAGAGGTSAVACGSGVLMGSGSEWLGLVFIGQDLVVMVCKGL